MPAHAQGLTDHSVEAFSRSPAPFEEVAAMVDLTADLQTTLWTVAESAEAAQVRPNVVRNWKYRGVLQQAGEDRNGRPLFRAIDVIKAEKATREKARRVYSHAA
jgi:hypothetical protein